MIVNESGIFTKIGPLIFIGFGGFALIGGLVLALDDPGGLVLSVFGLVLVGAGILMRRVFSAPPGHKAVTIAEDSFTTPRNDGRLGSVARGATVFVDEAASDDDIKKAKADWQTARLAERPDWIEGRIRAENERSGGLHLAAAVVWCTFALLAVGAGLIWGGFAWLVAAGACAIALALSVLLVVARMRQRKFGNSLLILSETPLHLGGRLDGVVETQLKEAQRPSDGFRVRLRCQRRWEESNDMGPTARPTEKSIRVETAWEHEGQVMPLDGDNLRVPVQIQLPSDAPATTLSRQDFGVVWDVRISADMPGLDFEARFTIPVLGPDETG